LKLEVEGIATLLGKDADIKKMMEIDADTVEGMGAEVGSTAGANAVSTGLPVDPLRPETSMNYEAGLHYREGIRKSAGPLESKSPNKHNRLRMSVEPLDAKIVEMLIKGEIHDDMDKRILAKVLRDLGWDTDESRGVWTIDERYNIFTDITKGVQRLDQIKGSITIGFVDAMSEGPLAGEPVRGGNPDLSSRALSAISASFTIAFLVATLDLLAGLPSRLCSGSRPWRRRPQRWWAWRCHGAAPPMEAAPARRHSPLPGNRHRFPRAQRQRGRPDSGSPPEVAN
jgi:hypothetical protein